MRVLLCGESQFTHSVHIGGVDSFTTSTYAEGADRLRVALAQGGIEVDYLPGHLVPGKFPATAAELSAYGALILSDIGASSILLAPHDARPAEPAPDRLAAIEQYVRSGGGLLMIGGYLSFAGIEGKARYHGTPVEDALPVTISAADDTVEKPQGVIPAAEAPGHPVLRDVPGPWPALLGYNRLTERPDAEVLVRCGTDPLLACWQYHAGRSAAFASDCAPRWAPPAFLDWPGYRALWPALIRWLGHSR